MKLAIGIGCDRGVSLLTLETALHKALARAGAQLSDICTLASIDKKNDEVALLSLAEQYAWPLLFFSAEQLAQVPVPNPSETVLKYMDTPTVSEAAALLAANATMESLVLEKYKYLGADDKNATVSIARIASTPSPACQPFLQEEKEISASTENA